VERFPTERQAHRLSTHGHVAYLGSAADAQSSKLSLPKTPLPQTPRRKHKVEMASKIDGTTSVSETNGWSTLIATMRRVLMITAQVIQRIFGQVQVGSH
jgi:hypothetical protein